ncbi:MAG: hypothetical protein VW625_04350 [Perlucidibaca sp.]
MSASETAKPGKGTVLSVVLVAVVLGVLAAWWLLTTFSLNLGLRDQPAVVQVVKPVAVQAQVLNNLDILLNGNLSTTVPVNQEVTLPIKDTLHVMATMDNDIPIKMDVAIRDKITIEQDVPVDTKVEVNVLGAKIRLPVRGNIPIKMVVPVNLNVPVNQPVRMKFTAPVAVKLQQDLRVPLKTDIATTIPLNSRMSVPVREPLDALVTIPQPLDTVITRAKLKIPLNTLGFSRNPDDAAPAPQVRQ